MEVLAEAVLSVSLETLFSQMGSPELLKFARQEQLHTELKKWEGKLLEIHEVLNDAEEKQITKPSVKQWLGDLRDLAYDMEDILDEFAYQVLRRKMMAQDEDGDEDEGSTNKVRRFIPTCCTSTIFSTPIKAVRNVQMGSKIKVITARLEVVCAEKAELGLDKVASMTQSTWQRPLTTSLAYEPWVYGRDADKQAVINMLLRDGPSETNASVVSIVAMGGMGKTTLARLVYDDVQTTKHFNLKAWVCVSDQFDVLRVTKTILNSVTSQSNDSLDFNQSQDKLRQELNGKRFLVVLDDMWNENYDHWCCLQSPFLSGSPGSKIVVTTRSKKVAIMMEGDKNLLELKCLSDDECWSVFKKHAFGSSINVGEHSNLAFIGKEIVKKCGGLPLAAKALGGLLRHEQREDKWNIILNSKIWELSGDKCGILPALRLSYNHLSSPLKRCFSYCGIFPQDFEFDKDELIRLWMAESLIPQSAECYGLQMEDIGDDYFQELLSRSFFQPSSGNESKFVMHDLINDLAKFVSRGVCFSWEENSKSNEQQNISRKTRYSSFSRGKYDVLTKFEAFHPMESLRTFMVIPIGESWRNSWLSSKVLEELVSKLRRLRVLSLRGYRIREIPDSFGDLKHLRYLNLTKAAIKWLPESICNLHNLETLILSNCDSLMRLPRSIGKLTDLRYLDITDTNLQEMPSQMSKLRSLQVLSNFIVSKENGSLNVKELKKMSHLGRGLYISKLENVVNVQDARDANLNKKQKLEELRIEWRNRLGVDSQINERNEMDVLECLQPHLNLKTLSIWGYGGSEFPRWVRDVVSFSKMVAIDLVNCRKCTSLPGLGRLPLLQRLTIKGMDEIKTIGAEFYGLELCLPNKPFPSLESLSFEKMSKWENWEHPSSSSSSSEPYPRLLRLRMIDCPKLIKTLPTYLPSLVDLSILWCPQLELSAGTRLPSLSKLSVWGCNEAVLRSEIAAPSLTGLFINSIVELTRLHEGFTWLLPVSEGEAEGAKEKRELPTKLESLYIWGCANLEKLPNGLHMLTSLRKLEISNCPKLVSLSDDFGFPPMLRSFRITDCEGLRCLPDDMMMMMKNGSNDVCLLESLEIERCPSLICFPKGQLPTTLKRLMIYHCPNLKSLPEGMMHCNSITTNHLEYLSIDSCSSLTSFPEGELPTTLNHLQIRRCENLKSLPAGKFPSMLKRLEISDCAKLESISEAMFHSGNNSLEYLNIHLYPYLKMLPGCLYNLRKLRLEDCENVELQPRQLQNLTALSSLTIFGCSNIKMPLSIWGLATLTSLKDLAIGGIFREVASFSDDQIQNHLPLLPTSLVSLSMADFQNLESLSSLALQSLTSLEMLKIERCPKLQSFCPREGLPHTLSQLHIGDCPLLKQRCSIETGQDWPNIAHIPYVEIDYKRIFEQ